MVKNFALIGCAGFIAPRHLQAIKETGNVLVAALDKSDSVGILDKYFQDVHFFTEFETFDRHAEKLRRQGEDKRIHFVSICSPNDLHDAHVRFAFRIGADAICEKPLVINPWNLNALEELEKESGKKVFNLLQTRHHPTIIKLKEEIDSLKKDGKHEVELTYITPRGKWYDVSWKGDFFKSGGIAMNLGIHFFDMLIWLFGKVVHSEVHHVENKRIAGYLELEKARVKWFLSTRKEDIPNRNYAKDKYSPYRLILIDGKELEFSEGFTNLHTEAYKQILNGNGLRIKDTLPAIELIYNLRNSTPFIPDVARVHGLLKNLPISDSKNYHLGPGSYTPAVLDLAHIKGFLKNLSNPSSENKEYSLHPSVEVNEPVKIGKGTKIWHYSKVLKESKIGEDCVIGSYVEIGPNVSIGSRCKIQNNVSIFRGVTLEDDVFCGPSMVFTNILNPRAFVERKDEFTEILVKRGATIGASATIVGNITIGRCAFIGAGSVVTKNVLDYALVLGVPGRQEGWVCECGEVVSKQLTSEIVKVCECKRCLKKYRHYLNDFSPLENFPKNENRIL
ncbi:MAG: Gfo/Idh/MocA family oxidoreductase [Nanoarchaeota archaeon]|nr:Gfo/Idh/MocA family oxidoreductase [Nanoarchaeota archaeon]